MNLKITLNEDCKIKDFQESHFDLTRSYTKNREKFSSMKKKFSIRSSYSNGVDVQKKNQKREILVFKKRKVRKESLKNKHNLKTNEIQLSEKSKKNIKKLKKKLKLFTFGKAGSLNLTFNLKRNFEKNNLKLINKTKTKILSNKSKKIVVDFRNKRLSFDNKKRSASSLISKNTNSLSNDKKHNIVRKKSVVCKKFTLPLKARKNYFSIDKRSTNVSLKKNKTSSTLNADLLEIGVLKNTNLFWK